MVSTQPSASDLKHAVGLDLLELSDRAEIVDTHLRYAQGIDRRDWPLYRSVFAARVRLDFTDWYGGDPLELDADEWVARVAARQTGFDSTQHQMSNHLVSVFGEHAKCTTYIVARHCIRTGGDDQIQAIGGYYENRLTRDAGGWKITECALKVQWTTGDRKLFDIAAERLRRRQNDGR